MFTGIVEEVGRVAAIERADGSARLAIRCGEVTGDASIGDSIAVAGCCVTVDALTDDGFAADLMAETLAATALGSLRQGDPVNLERPLRPGTRLGGHLVQGHVDGVGEVVGRDEQPGTVWLSVAAPGALGRYLVPKGSVTVDGASLTVVEVWARDEQVAFSVALIPHTLSATTFADRGPGDAVNLEVDVVAKYVERLLAAGTASPYDSLQET